MSGNNEGGYFRGEVSVGMVGGEEIHNTYSTHRRGRAVLNSLRGNRMNS